MPCVEESRLEDWKRVDASKRVDADEKAYKGNCGSGHAACVPDTKFDRFSLQMSFYSVMLKRVGIDVGDRRYVIRMHKELEEAEVVQTKDYDSVAMKLLEEEEARVWPGEPAAKRARV